MKLRTGNRRRRIAHYHAKMLEDRAFDERQYARMFKSGTLHKRANSGFVRRWNTRARAYRRLPRHAVVSPVVVIRQPIYEPLGVGNQAGYHP